MSNNLELWGKVQKTNPKYTKEAKVGGMKITSICPQYQVMMVTEQFGVYGKAWGFKNISLDYNLIEKYNMIVFKGTFFFPDGEFEIINSCKLYMDRKLTMLDDNFAKKIETDALTKAISKLGFNADVFLGKFDDSRYVNEMKEDFKDPKIKEIDNKLNTIKSIDELSKYKEELKFKNEYTTMVQNKFTSKAKELK